MPLLGPEDHKLSMRISPRARDPRANEGLRSLLVHRLTEGAKLVWRRSLRDEDQGSFFCEPCGQWTRLDEPRVEITCHGCGRVYRAEFAVYEEMAEDDS